MELRPYQVTAVDRIRESFKAGRRAPLLVAPTGSGKTTIFTYIAKNAALKGNRVLILTHRTELLNQSSSTLKRAGLSHGLIKPSHHGHLDQVAVASVQTLARRIAKQSLHYDLIIVDEAHLYMAATFRQVIASFPNARLLGTTATPIRSDGQGLGDMFDDLIEGPTLSELISMGFLVRPVYYAPTSVDMSGAKKSKGEFLQEEAEERANKPFITGSAVEHYRRLAAGEPAIAFCTSLAHAESVAEAFRQAGFTSEPVHGKLDKETRAERLAGLASGRIQVVTSVELLTTGTDIPCISTAIMLRPTASLAHYIQSIGRVLRPAPSKTRALILDHVNNCLRHGFVDDSREWSLDGVQKKSKGSEVGDIRQCKTCFAVYELARSCPYCGSVNPPRERTIEEIEGELKELKREEIAAKKERTAQAMEAMKKAKSWDELKEIGHELGYSEFYLRKRWGRKFGLTI